MNYRIAESKYLAYCSKIYFDTNFTTFDIYSSANEVNHKYQFTEINIGMFDLLIGGDSKIKNYLFCNDTSLHLTVNKVTNLGVIQVNHFNESISDLNLNKFEWIKFCDWHYREVHHTTLVRIIRDLGDLNIKLSKLGLFL